MEIIAIKCPNCSGEINLSPGQRMVRCPYCDSVLDIKAEPAEIALEKTKKEFRDIEHIRFDYAKRVQHWKGLTYLYYGLVYLLTIISFLLIDRCRDNSGGYDIGMIIILLLLISFLAIPGIFSYIVPVPPKEVEQPLRLKAGLPAAVKMAVTALLLALAGAFTAYMITETMGPSAARLEHKAEITVSESED